MSLIDSRLPNFSRLDAADGTIYGKYNTVNSVNPYRCRFVATYPDGSEIAGINLFTTGWDQIPDGLVALRYELSTGHVIEIPKYKAYLPLIEVSDGIEGSRVFHFINVNCLTDKEIILYKIVLKEEKLSPYKIGDIIMQKRPILKEYANVWKYTT